MRTRIHADVSTPFATMAPTTSGATAALETDGGNPGLGILKDVLRPLALVGTLALLATAADAAPAVVKTVPAGTNVYELAVAPDGPVYVATAGERGKHNSKILVLDPETLEIKNTIDMAEVPAFGITLNAKTNTLYATGTRLGAVAAVDAKAGKLIKPIATGNKAHLREITVDEAANRIYATVVGRKEDKSAIWVIDGATNTLEKTFDGIDLGATGLALDPKNRRLFTTLLYSNEVIALDTETGAVSARYPSGGEFPTNVAYDADRGRLYVTNQKSGTMTVLDADNGKLIDTVKTGDGALGVNFDAGHVYIANRGAGTVSVIDAETLKVLASLKTGSAPNTVAVDRKSGRVYVTNKTTPRPRDAPPVIDPNGDTVSLIRP
ncbi:YVTN family beta-propeller protein [Breoghania corrubedonensis]|uniref:YVTN family beta-propeller protein n=1 Tax=Breoghania corrubedonensis TaxID=665038 RepID=A0A2T5V6K4_9HYPH|nr:SMP-30/gluconolactonase/LRE family protein [Breoghania corrubedonensis]PTW59382.1 YVTN family beta-propeller protein [Breoghania corrubedonensis]